MLSSPGPESRMRRGTQGPRANPLPSICAACEVFPSLVSAPFRLQVRTARLEGVLLYVPVTCERPIADEFHKYAGRLSPKWGTGEAVFHPNGRPVRGILLLPRMSTTSSHRLSVN